MKTYTWEYKQPKKPVNGAWEQEVFRTLLTTCDKAAKYINDETGTDPQIFTLIADAATICALESQPDFEIDDSTTTKKYPIHKVGTIGWFVVYRDLTLTNNQIIISQAGEVVHIVVKGLTNSSVVE